MVCTSLTEFRIPNSLQNLGQDAFAKCTSLTTFIVSFECENYCAIDGALYSKDASVLMVWPQGRTDVNISETTETIGFSSFGEFKNLGNVALPNSVKRIESFAFNNCENLEEVKLSDSLGFLGQGSFYSCSSLESIELPNALAFLHWIVFDSCSSLKTMNIPASVVEIMGGSAFRN